MPPINVLCPSCHSPDTARLIGGPRDKPTNETALYGCKECLHTFVARRLEGTETFPAEEPAVDHARS